MVSIKPFHHDRGNKFPGVLFRIITPAINVVVLSPSPQVRVEVLMLLISYRSPGLERLPACSQTFQQGKRILFSHQEMQGSCYCSEMIPRIGGEVWRMNH
ncbi:unnamed protein product [Caretta caretta]